MTSHLSNASARLLGAFLLSLSAAACSGVSNPPSAPAAPATPTAAAPTPAPAAGPALTLMQQITAEVGTASCDNNAQCKTVAIGSKACGGPASYLAYSTKQSNGEKVTRLATADAAAQKAQQTSSGMVSTCSLVMDPGAVCKAGRCVTAGGTDTELPVR